MKDKERDTLDDLFRSKLQDFEVDTTPEDWEAIASRLPGKASVPFRRALRYWAAAAVVSLLMVTGGVYMSNKEAANTPVAQEIKRQTEDVKSRLTEELITNKEQIVPAVTASIPAVLKTSTATTRTRMRANLSERNLVSDTIQEEALSEEVEVTDVVAASDTVAEQVLLRSADSRSLIADAQPVSRKEKTKSPSKWGLGMGAGGLSAGSNNSVNAFALRSGEGVDEHLSSMNAVMFDNQLPKTDVKHKTPVSFGLSVSRFLNNRFSLQTGLNYSFLSSEWTTNSRYHGESKQKLHFIGIPLSLSYKIAEWNSFQFYAAAGGMTEVNVSGKVRTRLFSEGEQISSETQNRRMKEWLWSVNARAGVSYPVIRFVSAFAEVGAGYYFDNGSKIETIHSEKPFNVSLQVGFRLGF